MHCRHSGYDRRPQRQISLIRSHAYWTLVLLQAAAFQPPHGGGFATASIGPILARRLATCRPAHQATGDVDQDYQLSARCGVTLSVPLAAKWSAKLAWSRGLVTRVGGNFQTISIALQ